MIKFFIPTNLQVMSDHPRFAHSKNVRSVYPEFPLSRMLHFCVLPSTNPHPPPFGYKHHLSLLSSELSPVHTEVSHPFVQSPVSKISFFTTHCQTLIFLSQVVQGPGSEKELVQRSLFATCCAPGPECNFQNTENITCMPLHHPSG